MPILDAEVSLFPDDLLADYRASVRGRRWWVVYTMARQEKALARQLLRWEIPFYLPLVTKDSCIRGRRFRSHIPLFGGYVFLFARHDERTLALTTNRISSVLAVVDQEELHRDLQQTQSLIESGVELTAEPRLAPGNRVRVKGGPMRGLEGTIVSRRGRSHIFVAVNFLQQGASVAIDDCLLEPLD
jgi:transcription antitermination factor NusG